jgi:hypothetical protein
VAYGKGHTFEADVDWQDFVETLAEAYAEKGFDIHAYCLMHNPFPW